MWDWECIRGCVLGLASVCVFVVALYGLGKVGLVFVRTRWYALNVTMLLLATLQCMCTSIKYVFLREQRLSFTAAYFRGLQTLLTCATYAKSAAETGADPEVFARYYFPLLAVLGLYLTVLFLVAMSRTDDLCYHPRFLVMSISQMLIVLLFTIPGLTVMRKLNGALNVRYDVATGSNGLGGGIDGIGGGLGGGLGREQAQMVQQRQGLRVLLLFNAAGAVAQLWLDSWLKTEYDGDSCIMFETASKELARIVLKFVSYDLPVLATVYVYYHLPRRQFHTGLDIELPETDHLGIEEAFSAELLESIDVA